MHKFTASLVALATVSAALAGCAAQGPEEGEDDAVATEAALGNSPEAWRWFFSYKHRRQINAPIEATPKLPAFGGRRTVLLVPGTTIGPEFFKPMEARLRRDGFDPVVWAPADLFTESLAVGASRIGAKVDELRAARGVDRLHLVAQCDAGVAARYYAQVLGGSAKLDQFVTFVSAHHGTYAAPVASWVTGWQALRDIQPSSPFMKTLNGASMPAGLRFTSIYSCADTLMVPYSTSAVTGATNVEFCGHYVDHFDPFFDTTVYQRILVTLRGEGAGAPTYY